MHMDKDFQVNVKAFLLLVLAIYLALKLDTILSRRGLSALVRSAEGSTQTGYRE